MDRWLNTAKRNFNTRSWDEGSGLYDDYDIRKNASRARYSERALLE
jgi:hypothetical protein